MTLERLSHLQTNDWEMQGEIQWSLPNHLKLQQVDLNMTIVRRVRILKKALLIHLMYKMPSRAFEKLKVFKR